MGLACLTRLALSRALCLASEVDADLAEATTRHLAPRELDISAVWPSEERGMRAVGKVARNEAVNLVEEAGRAAGEGKEAKVGTGIV